MKDKIIDKFSILTTTAFGLIAALAWNGAIKAIFEKYYGVGEGISAMLIYAVSVTIIAVIATLIIAKIAEKSKQTNIRGEIRLIREKITLEKLRAIRLRKSIQKKS